MRTANMIARGLSELGLTPLTRCLQSTNSDTVEILGVFYEPRTLWIDQLEAKRADDGTFEIRWSATDEFPIDAEVRDPEPAPENEPEEGQAEAVVGSRRLKLAPEVDWHDLIAVSSRDDDPQQDEASGD